MFLNLLISLHSCDRIDFLSSEVCYNSVGKDLERGTEANMQLTLYTDYSLRMLIYLGICKDGGTIAEVADHFHISKNHLVKVAHHLGKTGYIHTTRGRAGGLRLAKSPEKINLGSVVRDTEPNFALVECFHRDGNHCMITMGCQLKSILLEAHQAFLKVLDNYSLADLLENRDAIAQCLGLPVSK
jgi:Rrf2 family transcriptional regulator, nitric oxide-sensitive transcriptional repressor